MVKKPQDYPGCGFVFEGTMEPIWWFSNKNIWKKSKRVGNIPWAGDDYYCGGGLKGTWLCTACAQKYGIEW